MLIDAVPQALRQGALHYLRLLDDWESQWASNVLENVLVNGDLRPGVLAKTTLIQKREGGGPPLDACTQFDAALAAVNPDVVAACLAHDFVTTRFGDMDGVAGVPCEVAEGGVYRWTTRPHTILTDKGRWALKESRHAEPADDAPGAAPDDGMGQGPALTNAERLVLCTLERFDSAMLVSVGQVGEAMDPSERLADRTVGKAIRKLADLGLVERPEGDRQGSRLTRQGRRLAQKIAD